MKVIQTDRQLYILKVTDHTERKRVDMDSEILADCVCVCFLFQWTKVQFISLRNWLHKITRSKCLNDPYLKYK